MTIAIVDQAASTRLRPPPTARPARRPASARGPMARPALTGSTAQALAGGSKGVVPPSSNTVRACRVDPVHQGPTSWRLTDRGIAVVLALVATIVLAAVTVIGLTAWHVTGPDYQATEVSQLSRR
jgi:hypothetical protein